MTVSTENGDGFKVDFEARTDRVVMGKGGDGGTLSS